MKIPRFNTAAPIYQPSSCYYAFGSSARDPGTIKPAFPRPIGDCWAICGGDPDCLQCCLCILRGRHPSQCCF
jgi:hypothetical protein